MSKICSLYHAMPMSSPYAEDMYYIPPLTANLFAVNTIFYTGIQTGITIIYISDDFNASAEAASNFGQQYFTANNDSNFELNPPQR